MSTPDRARARRVTSLLSSYYDGDDSVDADASTVRHRRQHGERIHDDGFVDRAAPSTSRASSASSIDLDSPLFSARAFVDDLSLPAMDKAEAKPPLEVLSRVCVPPLLLSRPFFEK